MSSLLAAGMQSVPTSPPMARYAGPEGVHAVSTSVAAAIAAAATRFGFREVMSTSLLEFRASLLGIPGIRTVTWLQ